MSGSEIPTRAEHDRFVRKIWAWCILGAIVVFLATGGTVLGLFLAGHDSKKVVEVSTSVFQVLVLAYGLGFFVPAFLTSLTKMALGVEMSRQGLEIGADTAKHIDRLQKELTPVIDNLKGAVTDARAIVKELREKELEKMIAVLDRVAGELDKIGTNGTIQETLTAIRDIPRKLDAITTEGRRGLAKRI